MISLSIISLSLATWASFVEARSLPVLVKDDNNSSSSSLSSPYSFTTLVSLARLHLMQILTTCYIISSYLETVIPMTAIRGDSTRNRKIPPRGNGRTAHLRQLPVVGAVAGSGANSWRILQAFRSSELALH